MRTKPVRGCNDLLPAEMELRNQVSQSILSTYKNNGFLMVKTPILESLENLTSGDSGENSKIMFKTIKRGAKLCLNKENLEEKDIAEEGLRYDLTVPLVRLFANNENNLPLPFKSIQIDDSFRAERPQEGRDRQFTQCDVDILGTESILGEIEIITTTMEAYKNVGLPNVVCKISSRKILEKVILSSNFNEENLNQICIIIDKIDKIRIQGCIEELEKLNFPKEKIEKLMTAIQQIKQNGIDDAITFGAEVEDVESIKKIIKVVQSSLSNDQKIEFDISIVRGQGYYTGAVFEMYCIDSGFFGAIGGGGRYDNMFGKFSGKDMPAVGFGLGLVSVLLALKKLGVTSLTNSKKLALIFNKDEDLTLVMQEKNLLKQSFDVSLFEQPKNFKELKRRLLLNGFTHIKRTSNEQISEI